MANATAKKEIVENNSKEVTVGKNEYSKEIKTVNSDSKIEISEGIMFFGCASDGNQIYDIEIAEGATHREARATRRAWVRLCRNHFWQFGIY